MRTSPVSYSGVNRSNGGFCEVGCPRKSTLPISASKSSEPSISNPVCVENHSRDLVLCPPSAAFRKLLGKRMSAACVFVGVASGVTLGIAVGFHAVFPSLLVVGLLVAIAAMIGVSGYDFFSSKQRDTSTKKNARAFPNPPAAYASGTKFISHSIKRFLGSLERLNMHMGSPIATRQVIATEGLRIARERLELRYVDLTSRAGETTSTSEVISQFYAVSKFACHSLKDDLLFQIFESKISFYQSYLTSCKDIGIPIRPDLAMELAALLRIVLCPGDGQSAASEATPRSNLDAWVNARILTTHPDKNSTNGNFLCEISRNNLNSLFCIVQEVRQVLRNPYIRDGVCA